MIDYVALILEGRKKRPGNGRPPPIGVRRERQTVGRSQERETAVSRMDEC